MNEKPVPGLPGYTINENGDIFSYKGKKANGHKMATVTTNCGYVHVSLVYTQGQSKPFLVHRLVAQAFIPNKDNKPQINHIDGNKQNNHFSNLEWCTRAENQLHAFETGLQDRIQGEDHVSAKLSNQDAIDIINLILNGASNEDIAHKYELHSRYVSLIRHQKRWKHLWDTKFPNVSAPVSKKLKGKYIDIAATITKVAYTTTRSNADIAEEFGCDASLICHIRNISKKCPSYFKPFIEKYL
jgi:hypothetical protein